MIYDLPHFIVFEGIDGSGKTTQSEMLFEFFLKEGVPVVKCQEPTNGKWGRKIRELLASEYITPADELMKLFIEDREQDARKNIIPSLNSKKMIIMDRYYFSNAAYQGAMGIKPDLILKENRNREFPEPDRVYLIDIDIDVALDRIRSRNKGNKDIFEKRLFLEKVREIYLSIADERFLVIDGAKEPDEILQIIVKDVQSNIVVNEE